MTENEKREQARLARNKYMRDYRAKNPEKMREIKERYWVRRAMKDQEVRDDAEKENG